MSNKVPKCTIDVSVRSAKPMSYELYYIEEEGFVSIERYEQIQRENLIKDLESI